MKEYIIDLTILVKPPHTDSISGRDFGKQHAIDTSILSHLQKNEVILLKIDSNKIKAINDSFIKGFFSDVFGKKNLAFIKEHVKFDTSNENFVKLFEKNWEILDSICNG